MEVFYFIVVMLFIFLIIAFFITYGEKIFDPPMQYYLNKWYKYWNNK